MPLPSLVLKLQSIWPHPAFSLIPLQDEEGQSEPFVQKLREQYDSEKEAYLQELKQDLDLEL